MSPIIELQDRFVGDLTEEELAAFEAEVKRGHARRYYPGVGGFMGVAKVDVVVSWGDGKKSRYGPTFASQVRDPFDAERPA